LISRRYKLHPTSATKQCPNDIKDAHKQKDMKKYIKEISSYSALFLIAAVQTPPRQHQKSSFSNSDASKKETVNKHYRRPIGDYRFLPRRISSLTKQCLQQDNCKAQPIKAKSYILTLRSRTLNISYIIAPTCRCRFGYLLLQPRLDVHGVRAAPARSSHRDRIGGPRRRPPLDRIRSRRRC
jgi:hypothetical protein